MSIQQKIPNCEYTPHPLSVWNETILNNAATILSITNFFFFKP